MPAAASASATNCVCRAVGRKRMILWEGSARISSFNKLYPSHRRFSSGQGYDRSIGDAVTLTPLN
eukprot:4098071-Pyramimonas_sp.AAC.1